MADPATVGSNYVGSQGDVMGDRWWASYRRVRGIILPRVESFDNPTSPQIGGRIGIRTISDGTSNTMAFSETVRGAGQRTIRAAIVSNVGPGWEGPPSECAQVRGSGGMIADTVGTTTVSTTDDKSSRWGMVGDVGRHSAFNAVLPPNSPSCARSGRLYSASSYHPGGVGVAMADGAVRFVTDSVNAGDPTLRNGQHIPGATGTGGDWQGPSSWGVWGAMATPAGGESVSLP